MLPNSRFRMLSPEHNSQERTNCGRHPSAGESDLGGDQEHGSSASWHGPSMTTRRAWVSEEGGGVNSMVHISWVNSHPDGCQWESAKLLSADRLGCRQSEVPSSTTIPMGLSIRQSTTWIRLAGVSPMLGHAHLEDTLPI